MIDSRYKVLTTGDEERAISNLIPEIKERIREWHDSKIDCIFLNETSATPFGFMFKQAWKEAYPNEKVPKFYRFSPKTIRAGFKTSGEKDKHHALIDKYFRERVNGSSRVVIFDEESQMHRQIDLVRYKLQQAGVPDGNILKDGGDLKVDSSEKKMTSSSDSRLYSRGDFGYTINQLFKPIRYLFIRPIPIPNQKFRERIFRKTFAGTDEYGGEINIWTKDYIHDLKLIGAEAGKEIRKESSSASLEGKVTSAIAIGSLLTSILFMSNNITGNVIAVNGTTTNVTGTILFIIGLIASLIYFKRR